MLHREELVGKKQKQIIPQEHQNNTQHKKKKKNTVKQSIIQLSPVGLPTKSSDQGYLLLWSLSVKKWNIRLIKNI